MSGAKKMVPKRRFKKFLNAGDWEQRKLGDVCNVYDGTHQTPRYTNSGVMFVSVEDIETLESNKYITEEDFKSEFKVFPEYGDILLTRIGDVGSANVILDEIKRAYYVSLALLKPKDINSLFLLALLSSSSVQSEIWRRTLHIAFPKKINKNEINKVIVNQPSIPEQKKIGKLFFSLDQTITLHQRKLDKLQATKKALLQEMFPEEGQDKPKRRFKGFTDAWEQRKLGDIVDFLDGQRKPLKESDRIKGKYPYYGASGIIDYINDYLFDENLVLLSEDGANIIDRNYPICFIATGKYWVNNHAHVLKVKAGVIDKFICESLERLDYTKFNTGTAQPKLNQDICQKIVITIPNEDEQKCISEFLDRINNIITLHQRKLDKLKNLKQAYLNEMFV